MVEFYEISFNAEELEALRRGCTLQAGREDKTLDEEAVRGSLEEVIAQESKADDMQLIKSTVSIFKPGQTILITREDLLLIKKCLEGVEDKPAMSAIKKIDAALLVPNEAGRQ